MRPDPALDPAVRQFSADRLRLARQSAGLRKNELAKAVGITPASITQYEQGQVKPRRRTLAALALALNRSVDYFAEDGRPLRAADPSTAFFRSLRATRQVEREKAAARAVLVWEVAEWLEGHVYLPRPDLPDLSLSERVPQRAIEEAAGRLREAWQLGSGPIAHVVRLLEHHGVIVARLSSVSPTIDAFSQLIGGRALVVLWAGKNDAARSRFDAAHELGHLVLHHDPEPGSKLLEDQAQAFASAFLMPEELVLDDLPRRSPRGDDWLDLFGLKLRWGVSLAAILYRARTLGVMSEPMHRRAMIQLSERGWRRHEPSDLGTPEQPLVLQHAVDVLAAHRKVGRSRIASDLKLPQSVVDEIVTVS